MNVAVISIHHAQSVRYDTYRNWMEWNISWASVTLSPRAPLLSKTPG
ncbi:MAG: hypothetical protein BWY06_02304 [Candidatus Latescibacteria bacterium ADurb.Bin168]|nr:MAG: hypothetical protein BWY06_02304 [Candidatus Latescibacteria bacterium ADurb.Bin168]